MTEKKNSLTQEAFDQILQNAFLPADQQVTIAPSRQVAIEPLPAATRVTVAQSISYAIARQAGRIAEARRRSKLTPEPTKSTLIDLRYKRLANQKAAKRPDEIARIMSEFPGGEYNDAFNKVNEGKQDVELLQVFDHFDPLDIVGDEIDIQSRAVFDAEYYRYAGASNALLLIRIDRDSAVEPGHDAMLRETLLAAKHEHDVIAEFENDIYVYLYFDTDYTGAKAFCGRLIEAARGFTVSIGCTMTRAGEEDHVAITDRADQALFLAMQEQNCATFA